MRLLYAILLTFLLAGCGELVTVTRYDIIEIVENGVYDSLVVDEVEQGKVFVLEDQSWSGLTDQGQVLLTLHEEDYSLRLVKEFKNDTAIFADCVVHYVYSTFAPEIELMDQARQSLPEYMTSIKEADGGWYEVVYEFN